MWKNHLYKVINVIFIMQKLHFKNYTDKNRIWSLWVLRMVTLSRIDYISIIILNLLHHWIVTKYSIYCTYLVTSLNSIFINLLHHYSSLGSCTVYLLSFLHHRVVVPLLNLVHHYSYHVVVLYCGTCLEWPPLGPSKRGPSRHVSPLDMWAL